MSRFNEQNPLTGYTTVEERLRRLEEELRDTQTQLFGRFIIGRLRTDRPAPISSADVEGPDQLYDMVRDDSYQYVLINLSGSLSWMRWSYSTF